MKRGIIMNQHDIEMTLLKMGIPGSVKGFRYIVDAIMLLDQDDWKDPKWTALYHTIGKMNSTTESRVERAIRSALETVRGKNGNVDEVEKYIGFINCNSSASLMSLYKNIKAEQCEHQARAMTITEEYLKLMIRQELKSLLIGMA